MLNFLKQSRKWLNNKDRVCIVIGNESCDLDSAVSALSLAYFYQQQYDSKTVATKSVIATDCWFLPVLNIPRCDYPLKTEVQFLFEESSIDANCLTFRDELQEKLLANSNFILVDHHVSPFSARCLEVFDHRPLDNMNNLPPNCRLHVELVGSCATLIADLILNDKSNAEMVDVLSLLRSTIILDTINFSATAARATVKDELICNALEQCLHISAEQRHVVFETLCKARADVGALTPLQLLHKDLKLLSNTNNSIRIALPGFPLSVQQFICKPSAAIDMAQFSKQLNCAIIILMGLYEGDEDSNVQRDLGLVNVSEPELCETIRRKLLDSDSLCLEPYSDCSNFMNGHFYRQGNIKATRKHIVPLIKEVLVQWPE